MNNPIIYFWALLWRKFWELFSSSTV